MFQLKTVGVLLRDPSQEFPIEQMERLLGRVGAKIHFLNSGPPKEKLDLVIAMGGDGTVLQALEMLPECPVLAINFGTVGFLTAGDSHDLEGLLSRLLENDFVVSARLLLRCEYQGKTAHAVNEVVLRSTLGMIQVEVFVNEARIRTIRGDGVIVGTPTGSTGYLLSTGAPVVMPDVNCFILDGINEYNFSSRALILPPESSIRLHIPSLRSDQEVILMVDGKQRGNLKAGEEAILSQWGHRARLIFFDKNYFFHNLSSRLSWN